MARQIQYRQGDMLLVQVPPKDRKGWKVAPVNGRLVLARGEATGHAHTMDPALAELFEERGGNLYLRVAGATRLVHQEHAPIVVEPGSYKVIRQREYEPASFRQVMD